MTAERVYLFGLLCLCALAWGCARPSYADCCIDPPGYFGPGIGADNLANTLVGGQYNAVVSYRIRSPHSGPLQSIVVYLLPDKPGYSAGTGGKIRVTVNADDGTSAHNPSNTVLASYLISDPMTTTPSRYFPQLTFSSPPMLTAGQIYHIVFTNVDSQPAVNYLSVDTLYETDPGAQTQPTMSDNDSAILLKQAGNPWTERKGFTPVISLNYADGWKGGLGYMEVWNNAIENASGSSAVREILTITGGSKTVGSVSVRTVRQNGSDPLEVRLESANGTVIEQGDIPADSIPLSSGSDSHGSPLSYAWVTYKFASARTLASGNTYYLVFEAPSTSAYSFFPIRKGSAYGFPNASYFADGHAEFRQNDGNWTGWTEWGVTNRTDGDLQFYFTLADSGFSSSSSLSTSSSLGPTISNANAATPVSATITWNTDQPATSQVEYGTTTAYSYTTSVDAAMLTNHSVTLSGLTASTVYHYRILSTNSSGVQTTSGDLTFSTP